MGLLDTLGELLSTGLRRTFSVVEHDVRHLVHETVQRSLRYFIREVASIGMILLAAIFFSIGAVFFLIEYVVLSKTISFLIVGSIILFVGIILRLNK